MKIKKTFEGELKDNPKFREEYQKTILPRKIAVMFINMRAKRNLTQRDLANIMHKQQPSIARVENMRSLPGLRFLEEAAKALGTELVIDFKSPLETQEVHLDISSNHTGVAFGKTENGRVPYNVAVYSISSETAKSASVLQLQE